MCIGLDQTLFYILVVKTNISNLAAALAHVMSVAGPIPALASVSVLQSAPLVDPL